MNRTYTATGSVLLALALLPVAGCEETVECVEEAADPATAEAAPLLVHTGVNGRDVFRAVITSNFGLVNWVPDDPALLTVQRIGCVRSSDIAIPTALITARAAGTTTVTGTSGEFETTVQVVIAQYSPDEFDAGQARYNTPPDAPNNRRACADCHFGADAIPHTPDEIAKFSDDDLLLLTTQGREPDQCLQPDGGACRCTPEGDDPATACAICPEGDCALVGGRELELGAFDDRDHGAHVWDLSPDEERGIVAFMRGIAPAGF